MALCTELTGGGSQSAIGGLLSFWADASKPPTLEWEKRMDILEVALMAKNNIAISELIKTAGTQKESLIGDLDEIPATKTAINVLYLALGPQLAKPLQKRLQELILQEYV